MGSGKFDHDVYSSVKAFTKASGGPTFAYSVNMSSTVDPTAWKAHVDLDPKLYKKVTVKDKDGKQITIDGRESRDSDEHPESVPVAVFFDVTGSMHGIPVTFQDKLPKLMTLLVTKGGLAHPQVLFGAVGDAYSDHVPFQAGQFESDNRCDEQLRNMFLEGGGGGQDKESYDLAYYFGAYKTSTDSFEKRGKKGYLFTIGDERFYPSIKAGVIEKVFGDKINEDVKFEAVMEACKEKWEVFHIHVAQGSYGEKPKDDWKRVLGERVLVLEDADQVAEMVAGVVALNEGADWKDVVDDLGGAAAVTTALKKVASTIAPAKTAKASGSLPDTKKGKGAVKRV